MNRPPDNRVAPVTAHFLFGYRVIRRPVNSPNTVKWLSSQCKKMTCYPAKMGEALVQDGRLWGQKGLEVHCYVYQNQNKMIKGLVNRL